MNRIRPFLKYGLIALLGMVALVVALLCFAIDNSPLPVIHQGLNRDDIQLAKQLLNIAPEEKQSIKHLSLNQKELNIATNYLLNHFVESTTQVAFIEGKLWFQIAVFLPKSIWGRYLDFSFKFVQVDDGVRIKSLKIGEISIPDPAANRLIPFVIEHSMLREYRDLARQYIKEVRVSPQSLDISYLGAIVDDAKQLARQKHKDYPSLYLYQQQINDIVNRHDPAWRLSLSELMQPLFESAYQRSTAETAIQENRAVIIAVASYIYKSDLRRFLPLGLVYSKEYPVFAYKRIDIPQHFIASALVTAIDSPLLADQMGVDKEIGDSQQGSGFSFIDLTADHAGKLFGQIATASPEKARQLQQKMRVIQDYTALLPDIADLPEHMDEATFKLQYQAVDSASYRTMVETIDQRIRSLGMYQ